MNEPLAGLRVVVTRAESQAGELVAALHEAGAEVAELPLLEIVPPADPGPLEHAAAGLGRFRWVVLTSANAARALLPRVPAGSARPRVAVVGDATGRAVETLGWSLDLQAADSRAEGLTAELLPLLQPGDRILLPQAADARPLLGEALASAGFEPEVVVAYAKRLPVEAPARAAELFATSPLGWVTFTSPSTVRHFVEVLGTTWPARSGELRAASIGPTTTAALVEAGIEPAAEAAEPRARELVAALVGAVHRRAPTDYA